MPKVSEEYREARRQQILAASVVCFARKGIHPTTMDDICTESRLSRGAIYGYYASKQAIIEAVFVAMEQATRGKLSSVATASSATEALFSLAQAAFVELAAPAGSPLLHLDQMLKAESTHNPALLEHLRQNAATVYPLILPLIVQAQAEGSFPADLDPEMILRFVVAVQDGVKVQLLIDPQIDLDRFVETMRRLILRPSIDSPLKS